MRIRRFRGPSDRRPPVPMDPSHEVQVDPSTRHDVPDVGTGVNEVEDIGGTEGQGMDPVVSEMEAQEQRQPSGDEHRASSSRDATELNGVILELSAIIRREVYREVIDAVDRALEQRLPNFLQRKLSAILPTMLPEIVRQVHQGQHENPVTTDIGDHDERRPKGTNSDFAYSNERATLEQKKTDESMLRRLAEEQKREKEKLHRRIIELEKQLYAKQALELEIQRMQGALQVMQHMKEDENMEMKRKLESVLEELKERVEELHHLEELHQALIVKELKCNDELQEAKKELIYSLNGVSAPSHIGVKRIGELDLKPFLIAAKRKYSAEEADEKAAELCSLWQEYLLDSSWHPCKICKDKEANAERILDEEDKKLIALKTEFGDEVYTAVTTALAQMNEHNASGRYIAPELWNFREGRKATVKDGVKFLLKMLKLKQIKRRRY